MSGIATSRARMISLTSLNAALYAFLGYLTYLGIFAPVFFVVRFWPAVVVPGVFSYLAGPVVGGCGAAIGIFVSDIIIHGDPILSLLVGVTSNFLGFYTVGYLAERLKAKAISLKSLSLAIGILAFVAAIMFYKLTLEMSGMSTSTADMVPGVAVAAVILVPFLYGVAKGDIDLMRIFISSTLGLALGSAIIGFGVWGYSQVFRLPPSVMGGASGLPTIAIPFLALWTFVTEIPFLLILVPPIYRALKTLTGGGRGW